MSVVNPHPTFAKFKSRKGPEAGEAHRCLQNAWRQLSTSPTCQRITCGSIPPGTDEVRAPCATAGLLFWWTAMLSHAPWLPECPECSPTTGRPLDTPSPNVHFHAPMWSVILYVLRKTWGGTSLLYIKIWEFTPHLWGLRLSSMRLLFGISILVLVLWEWLQFAGAVLGEEREPRGPPGFVTDWLCDSGPSYLYP